jgi:tetratricopeptide (TPR) repeat protein
MPWNQQVFDKALDKGHSAAWDQNWDEAIKCYKEALREFPDNAVALTSLGLVLMETQDYEGALKSYEHAAKINPKDPVVFASLARLNERLGRLDDAVSNYLQAADMYEEAKLHDKSMESLMAVAMIKPENIEAREHLATVYETRKWKVEALDEFLSVASLVQKSGDYDRAIKIVEHALEVDPDHADAQRALQLLKTGQPLPPASRPRGGTATISMSRVQQMQKKDEKEKSSKDPITEAQQKAMVKLAGILFEKEEDPQISGQVSRRGISALTRGTGGLSTDHSGKSRMRLHLSRAIDLQTQGQDDKAAEELERAAEIGLGNAEAFFNLGYLFQGLDPQKSIKYLMLSVRHPDYALGSYLLLAKLAMSAEQLPDAAAFFLQALAMADCATVTPEHAATLNQLYEPIIESQSHETDQTKLRSLCDAIASQLLRKDWQQYLIAARQQLSGGEESPEPLPLAGMLLETKGSRVVEALADMRRLEKAGFYRSAMEIAYNTIPFAPTYLPLQVKMGEVLISQGHINDAVEKFILTAESYNLRGETPQAIGLLNRVAEMAPMDLSIRSKLIELLVSQERVEEALSQYIELADVYYKLAELDMARQTYMAGLKLAQDHKVARQWAIQMITKIADIDIQRLDWRNAIRMYEQLRTLQPEESNARAKLIDLNIRLGQPAVALSELDGFVSYLRNTNQTKVALTFITDMIKEHPEMIDLQRRFADLLIKENKKVQAVQALDGILKTFLNIGNKQGAMEILNQIMSLKPPNLKEYQDMVGKLNT